MGPDKPLPHSAAFATPDAYIDSLLAFVGTDPLLRTLCGGVHVLDFFTSDPPLYDRVLPPEWRDFFREHDVMDILDLLMREDLAPFDHHEETAADAGSGSGVKDQWRQGRPPPRSLLNYISTVRIHLLDRAPPTRPSAPNTAPRPPQKLARNVAVGMNVKKVHEVALFAHYIATLADTIPAQSHSPTNDDSSQHQEARAITHLVDFGSGQNYLGRALASEPYHRRIVAVESREHNAERARKFDVTAKLAARERGVLRNKKAFRQGGVGEGGVVVAEPISVGLLTPPPSEIEGEQLHRADAGTSSSPPTPTTTTTNAAPPTTTDAPDAKIQYINHRIASGDLSAVLAQIPAPAPTGVMVMSLHSCGNLVHHGLRALTINPAVRAVAMVGCCYNLLTERLGPATYKLPGLRTAGLRPEEDVLAAPRQQQKQQQRLPPHPRVERLGAACDPDGFPMSARFCSSPSPNNTDNIDTTDSATPGVRLNITARMMAVQAPSNWGPADSASFFTRHFYRALLQRVFFDYGVIGPPLWQQGGGQGEEGGGGGDGGGEGGGGSPAGHSSGTPIIIGSLRKACYTSFTAYVRGALAKLCVSDSAAGGSERFRALAAKLSDAELEHYEARFRARKKELSVIWSLMAFSAGVIEAAIVVDRFLWLGEQEVMAGGAVWVEAVFDYALSPRNLVVVGVKR
ncbi:hypothetical protein LTR08_007139 [Meristemomyces frigidus]|nr:hypothetical protein LTR08_007139 [Meristemomyces frigidus]